MDWLFSLFFSVNIARQIDNIYAEDMFNINTVIKFNVDPDAVIYEIERVAAANSIKINARFHKY